MNEHQAQSGVPHSVAVDRGLCQTAAICLAYSIYELDDEAKAVLLTANGQNSGDPSNVLATNEGYVKVDDLVNATSASAEEMRELVMESARACPFNAIMVKDSNGLQLWP